MYLLLGIYLLLALTGGICVVAVELSGRGIDRPSRVLMAVGLWASVAVFVALALMITLAPWTMWACTGVTAAVSLIATALCFERV